MLVDKQIFIFVAVVAILTITPGADTALVFRNVLTRGQRAGFFTTLGICSGLFFYATLSALGLSIILVRSTTAYEIVKLIGALYLLFLGCSSLWRAHSAQRHQVASSDEYTNEKAFISHPGRWRSAREGFLSNILNPKIAVFYLAFLPQFIHPGDPVLAKSFFLAGIHVVLAIIWLSLITLLLGKLRKLLTQPAVRRVMEGITGLVLIVFGLFLAAESH
jgi:threonine/homoserine/homoserine lactone efflux protein